MKKMLLMILLLVSFCPVVKAKNLGYQEYRNLNIEHSFVVGDYIFDVSYGYSPSLKDFMHASRTIPQNEDVYVEEIILMEIPELDIFEFSSLELYSKREITDISKFKTLKPKYVYRANIDGASSKDYTVLS